MSRKPKPWVFIYRVRGGGGWAVANRTFGPVAVVNTKREAKEYAADYEFGGGWKREMKEMGWVFS